MKANGTKIIHTHFLRKNPSSLQVLLLEFFKSIFRFGESLKLLTLSDITDFPPYLKRDVRHLQVLAHLRSSELLSVICLTVCPPVHPSVCKLFTLSSTNQEPLGQFQQNLAQSIIGLRELKLIELLK